MQVADQEELPEEHFTEGEPDLEAPEELALEELDDEQMLEDELDNEDISEEDVDEITLQVSLEHLVHKADTEETSLLSSSSRFPNGATPVDDVDLEDLVDLEVADLEDFEEGLDTILAQRLAEDGGTEDVAEGSDEQEGRARPTATAAARNGDFYVSGCKEDEFVCRSCFLVRSRAQLADAGRGTCRDCSA